MCSTDKEMKAMGILQLKHWRHHNFANHGPVAA